MKYTISIHAPARKPKQLDTPLFVEAKRIIDVISNNDVVKADLLAAILDVQDKVDRSIEPEIDVREWKRASGVSGTIEFMTFKVFHLNTPDSNGDINIELLPIGFRSLQRPIMRIQV